MGTNMTSRIRCYVGVFLLLYFVMCCIPILYQMYDYSANGEHYRQIFGPGVSAESVLAQHKKLLYIRCSYHMTVWCGAMLICVYSERIYTRAIANWPVLEYWLEFAKYVPCMILFVSLCDIATKWRSAKYQLACYGACTVLIIVPWRKDTLYRVFCVFPLHISLVNLFHYLLLSEEDLRVVPYAKPILEAGNLGASLANKIISAAAGAGVGPDSILVSESMRSNGSSRSFNLRKAQLLLIDEPFLDRDGWSDVVMGVVYHELGHIAYGHSKYYAYAYTILGVFLFISNHLILWMGMGTKNKVPFVFTSCAGVCTFLISRVLFNVLFNVSFSHRFEYAADSYAVKNGCAHGLERYLRQSLAGAVGWYYHYSSLFGILFPHPSSHSRLQAVYRSLDGIVS